MVEMILGVLRATAISLLSAFFSKRFLLRMVRSLLGAYVKRTKTTLDDEWFADFSKELDKQIG